MVIELLLLQSKDINYDTTYSFSFQLIRVLLNLLVSLFNSFKVLATNSCSFQLAHIPYNLVMFFATKLCSLKLIHVPYNL